MKNNRLVKFENLGIEVDFAQEQNGKKFSEIQIRKGWRLLKLKELEEVMNYIMENHIKILSYFEQPIIKLKNDYVARFIAYSDGANLYYYRNPESSNSSLGVIFCRDIKGEEFKEVSG